MIRSEELLIKPVLKKELTILRNLAEQTFRSTYAHLNDPLHFEEYIAKHFQLSKLKAEWANPNSYFYFALVDGLIGGYLKLNTGDAQTESKLPNALEVERIYVKKTYQGRGVGRYLIQQSQVIALELQLNQIWLGVWEENPKAIRFYEKNGFKKFGKHIFKVGPEEQIDYLMKLELI